MMYILTLFQSNRLQHVMVDGCESKLVTFCQGCGRAVFFRLVIVNHVHFGAFFQSGK